MNSKIASFAAVLFISFSGFVAAPSLVSAADLFDPGGSYDLGYGDIGGSMGGSYDLGYGDIGGGCWGCGGSYDLGYGDIGGYGGSYDLGYGDIGGSYDLGYGSYGCSYCGGSSYYPTYSSTPSYSYPKTGGHSVSYSKPIGFGYPTTVPTFSAPGYSAPVSTSNTNTNNNTNVNNIVNNNNSSASASVVVNVLPAPVQTPVVQYVQPPVIQPAPYCTISITNYNSSSYGAYGTQLATLTWSSGNATSGYISPTVGTVSGYGSMQVYPTNGQIYTMTVYGQGGQANCTTQPFYVAVAPVVTYQNPAQYVSLSQIPYTGLELGFAGNIAYWTLMAAFALAAAYLVVYFQGGALAFLGSRKGTEAATPAIAFARPALRDTEVAAPIEVKAAAPVETSTQLATNRIATADKMQMHVKAGHAPRIVISRA